VVLLSRAGVELYRWDLGAKGAVAGAHLIEAAAGSRDGDLVVIGATWTARWSYGGHLCAFRVDAPGELAWSSSADRIVPPPDLHDRPEARFAIERIWVEDVFEECPGPEIVAAQRLSEYAATAMCVFDSTGRVRYRVWNDGPISGLAWLSAAHRLIATSSDTETRWDAAVAQPAVPHPRYPAIAFAVEPVLDRCANDWIARSGAVRDETLRWYRWLGPSESLAGVAGLRCQVLGDVGELDPKSHVAIGFAPDTEDPTLIRAMVDFLLDADGRVVRQWTTDDWKVAEQARRVPDAARLTLLPYEALQR
jgi:hypothetical protein